MTSKQRGYQISLLRQLHLSERYIQLYKDDPIAYRAWLKKHLDVDSSKDLRLDTLISLVQYFQFKSDDIPHNRASTQQIGFIRHLWSANATYKDEASLLSFVDRVTGRELDTLESLTPTQASKVIFGVKNLKPKTIEYANNPAYGA